MSTSTRSFDSVYHLCNLLEDDELVHDLICAWPEWETLYKASHADLGHVVGHKGAGMGIPEVPDKAVLPDGWEGLTRYSLKYPGALRDFFVPPAYITVKGRVPGDNEYSRRVFLACTRYPSPAGAEVLRSAMDVVAKNNITAVVLLEPQYSNAIEVGLENGARLIAVATSGISSNPGSKNLIDRIVAAGGAVISGFPPATKRSSATVRTAERLAAGLASATLVVEVTEDRAGGKTGVEWAIKLTRTLLVVKPVINGPGIGSVNAALASARDYSAAVAGTNARIAERVKKGYSPADAVVEDPTQLAAGIAEAFGTLN